jgi:hypothetical protein
VLWGGGSEGHEIETGKKKQISFFSGFEGSQAVAAYLSIEGSTAFCWSLAAFSIF